MARKITPALSPEDRRAEDELDEMLQLCLNKMLETLAILRDIQRRYRERQGRLSKLQAELDALKAEPPA